MNGKIFDIRINKNFKLVTGRSEIKIRETSPIVRQVRDYIKKYREGYDICIIDTAAGTHCTVIAALEETDEVYIVTEPTPLGLHDLKLVLELVKVLDLENKVIINKYNLGRSEDIYKLVKKHRSSIFIEIPYEKKIEQIYMKGEFGKHPDLFKLLKIKHE